MRNERRSALGAERPAAATPDAAGSMVGSASSDSLGRAGRSRGSAAIDAQILQILRDRLRTSGSLESVAGEVLRLGSLAAALHRGARAGLSSGVRSGTRLAMSIGDAPVDRDGVEVSEDAA
jgi:hypothetical protein